MTTTEFGLHRREWHPHEYQRTVLQKMLSQRAVGLFLDPGLGKTSIVLAAFKHLKEAGIVNRMLVVAPLRPVYNVWPSEIEKWANFMDLKYTILHGRYKEQRLNDDSDIFIINPEGITWLLKYEKRKNRIHTDTSRLAATGVDVLCLDESTRFKDPSTNRFKALKRHLSMFKIRWCLTGTPMPNGVQDLFGQMYMLDHGRALGQYITAFRQHFMYVPNPRNPYHYEMQEGAFDRLTEVIKPLVIQLSAEDHIKMPERIYNRVEVELPPHAMKAYREVENEFITKVEEGIVVATNMGVAGTKLRQIANGAVYSEYRDDPDAEWIHIHDAKIEALVELREELGGKPIMLLYEYQHDRDRILKVLGEECRCISGASPKQGDEMIQQFNMGQLPVLLGHPASMGHGLNLQVECYNVVWFGITWNLEHYIQANARVWRQGQENPSVVFHHIVAKNTRDERVEAVLSLKDATQRQLLSEVAKR